MKSIKTNSEKNETLPVLLNCLLTQTVQIVGCCTEHIHSNDNSVDRSDDSRSAESWQYKCVWMMFCACMSQHLWSFTLLIYLYFRVSAVDITPAFFWLIWDLKHTSLCVLCRWPSPRGLSSRASCWAASTRRPTWRRSSWSPATTRTGSTPSTCRRATGWAASEPSETPDTTGEQGQDLSPGAVCLLWSSQVDQGLILNPAAHGFEVL